MSPEEIELKMLSLVEGKLGNLERTLAEHTAILESIRQWATEHRREHFHTRLAMYGIVATLVVMVVGLVV